MNPIKKAIRSFFTKDKSISANSSNEFSNSLKRLSWILRLIICFALLFFLFKQVHFAEIFANFKKISFSSLFIVLALTLIGQIFLVLRWQIILANLKTTSSFWRLFKYYFIGLFFNMFLPSTVGGDAVKGYTLYKDNKKLQISFFSIFVDRYIGVFSLIFLAFLASFFVNIDYKGYPISVCIFILVLIYVFISFILLSSQIQKLVNSKRTKMRFFYTIANSILKTVKFIIKNKSAFFICLFYSFGCYLTIVLIHYLLAIELGRPVSFGLLFIYIAIISLGSMIPISINGIGLREFLYVYLFSFCGWSGNLAVSVCWVAFGMFLIVSALGGIFYLFKTR